MKEQVIRSAIGLAIFLAGALAAVVFLCYESVSTQSVIWIGIITGVAVLGYGILGTATPAYARSMAMFMGGHSVMLVCAHLCNDGRAKCLRRQRMDPRSPNHGDCVSHPHHHHYGCLANPMDRGVKEVRFVPANQAKQAVESSSACLS